MGRGDLNLEVRRLREQVRTLQQKNIALTRELEASIVPGPDDICPEAYYWNGVSKRS